ncbi:MBOAT family protein [Methylosinus sp. Sm6]|uniref:MBOAT family O-acyltransferase n=1 Tax=Methylosinus sp. Sm6 TaxID=2866948 RepID=UPI001C99997C|nr:MBOAT family protein [Methylosinus sp. Sm6]MBY6242531.1 MBOAT family protein [Methylosinus sp. Sm6]
MLFTSPVFLFGFLPVVLCGFLLLRREAGNDACALWLTAASFVFYGWWSPSFLLVLLASTTINFALARSVERVRGRLRRAVFLVGLAGNLALLGYFKYADFLISSVNDVAGTQFALLHIVLPLGISFFTFQKIAYLADIYAGKAATGRFADFALFVFFFPQLIAGPIVHHAEVMPQFSRFAPSRRAASEAASAAEWESLAIGAAMFLIGLIKKVVVADQLAPYSSPAFAAAHDGPIGFILGWQAALCFSVQLYFDFSGYSDMAIGLARLFGLRLPANFASPYAATSIGEFWRRWHMTLSRFLRDYVYIPLGGSRQGAARHSFNLMTTMLLGGLWHGAGYTFILWGGLHGVYLLIAHAWTNWGRLRLPPVAGWLLTLLAVVVALVPFRAASLGEAANILEGMTGLNGLHGAGSVLEAAGLEAPGALAAAAALLLACAVLPNTQQIMRRYEPTVGAAPAPIWRQIPIAFSPSLGWAAFLGLGAVAVELFSWQTSEFLYFQF